MNLVKLFEPTGDQDVLTKTIVPSALVTWLDWQAHKNSTDMIAIRRCSQWDSLGNQEQVANHPLTYRDGTFITDALIWQQTLNGIVLDTDLLYGLIDDKQYGSLSAAIPPQPLCTIDYFWSEALPAAISQFLQTADASNIVLVAPYTLFRTQDDIDLLDSWSIEWLASAPVFSEVQHNRNVYLLTKCVDGELVLWGRYWDYRERLSDVPAREENGLHSYTQHYYTDGGRFLWTHHVDYLNYMECVMFKYNTIITRPDLQARFELLIS